MQKTFCIMSCLLAQIFHVALRYTALTGVSGQFAAFEFFGGIYAKEAEFNTLALHQDPNSVAVGDFEDGDPVGLLGRGKRSEKKEKDKN
ncbi:MAG: hypothetical protein LWW94_09620 [Candidatus Desulfofervidaceae bacterium]|nr:hypothetical protein [Candidatus Desulfofervidaceae bacterium]